MDITIQPGTTPLPSEQTFLDAVQSRLVSIVPRPPHPAGATVTYALAAPGGSIRPRLTYATFLILSKNVSSDQYDRLIRLAAAVELLHTASLLHDDVIDEEEIRRGQESLPAAFGNTRAILTGNILYIAAFTETLTHLDITQVRAVLDTAAAMCDGELLQAGHPGGPMPETLYMEIIRKKTATLMAMACSEAARILNADTRTIETFHTIGESFGILYQIRDDSIDNDISLTDPLNRAQIESIHKKNIAELLTDISSRPFPGIFQDFIS